LKATDLFEFTTLLISGITYYLVFWFNDWLFKGLKFSAGNYWIYLPAGINLALTLVLGTWAALGLALGAFLVTFQSAPHGGWLEAAVQALMVGLGPALTFWFAQRVLRLNPNLQDRSPQKLLVLALLFSAISALLKQLLVNGGALGLEFITPWAVQTLGNFLGTLVCLYLFKLALFLADNYPRQKPLN
jgi:hypothetical protein